LVNVSKNDDKNTYWMMLVKIHIQTITQLISAMCGNKNKHWLMLVINHKQNIPCPMPVNNNH